MWNIPCEGGKRPINYFTRFPPTSRLHIVQENSLFFPPKIILLVAVREEKIGLWIKEKGFSFRFPFIVNSFPLSTFVFISSSVRSLKTKKKFTLRSTLDRINHQSCYVVSSLKYNQCFLSPNKKEGKIILCSYKVKIKV